MKLHIFDKGPRLEILLTFPDSRAVDLEIALFLAGKEADWQPQTMSGTRSGLEIYRIRSERDDYLGTVRVTYGLEPPTRAVLDNQPPGADTYEPAARHSVIAVAGAFLEECAHRGLVSEVQKTKAIAEIRSHDHPIEVGSNA